MFLRFFKSYQPTLLIIIPLLGILLWFSSFLNPSVVTFPASQPMPLYAMLSMFVGDNKFIEILLSFLLTISFCFLLVNLNTKFIFISERTYLPALFSLSIISTFNSVQALNPVIFAGVILVFALGKLLESNIDERMSYNFLDASFLVSLGSLFYPFLLVYILPIWISLIFLRPMYWREWMFSIIGLIAPYALILVYYYVFTKFSLSAAKGLLVDPFNHPPLFSKISTWYYILWAYILFLILLASNHMLKAYFRKKILVRKSFLIFLWFFLVTILAYILIPSTSFELIILISIPVSFLLSDYFLSIKSLWWGETLFVILFLLILLVMIYAN
jgi:hypothetical protein